MSQESKDQSLELEKYVKLLTRFIQEYNFLINCYVLDYFVEDHWSKIPLSWRRILESMETCDIAVFLNSKQPLKTTKVLPLSLLAFRATSFALALRREPISSTVSIRKFLQECFKEKLFDSEDYYWTASKLNYGFQNKNLPEMCRKHVKPKKQHEIYRLSQVINSVLKNVGVERVVDIGSGLGHLSRLLSLQYDLDVITIEASSSHTSSASYFDNQALESLKKKAKYKNIKVDALPVQNTSSTKLPQHFERHISSDCYDYFNLVLKEAWDHRISSMSESEKLAVLGLHACGDLSSTLLKLFIHEKNAKVLFSVSCCYMKLNEKDSCGYPLSSFVKALPNHFLSYEARELSCHAIEKYQSRLKENSSSLKVHCFRALLEKIITSKYPDFRHMGLKSIKSPEIMTFAEYARNALCKQELDISDEDLFSTEIELCTQEWKKVVILYSLRLLAAPVIESLILTDRMLYLIENGFHCCTFPIFEPDISPRNHLLLAIKKDVFL